MTEEQAAQILQGITDLNMTAVQLQEDLIQLQTDLSALQIVLAILSGIVLGGFLIGILYDMWRH